MIKKTCLIAILIATLFASTFLVAGTTVIATDADSENTSISAEDFTNSSVVIFGSSETSIFDNSLNALTDKVSVRNDVADMSSLVVGQDMLFIDGKWLDNQKLDLTQQ